MRNYFALILAAMCMLSSALLAMDKPKVKMTKNGFGLNFDSLGDFEEAILSECQFRAKSPDARFLFLAAAFGRLPLRIVNELQGDAKIVVNELAPENIEDFTTTIANLAAQESGQPPAEMLKMLAPS